MLGQLPDHPRLLVQRGIFYERGDRWFTSADNEDDEHYGLPARPERIVLIIKPFARLTLGELLPRLSPRLKLVCFYQILEGANALQNARPSPLVRRDLKPANIGVVPSTDQSIAKVILDYGQTIQVQRHNSIRGRAATPGYQAPEMQHQVHNTSLVFGLVGLLA
jgi:serine/threonine protein kinase